MKKYSIHEPSLFVGILLLVLLAGLFYSNPSHANTNPMPGTQLAYFIGYHSGGLYNNTYHNRPHKVYYSPKYHHKGTYKASWTSKGHSCQKSCWVDRWTGKALRCYTTC